MLIAENLMYVYRPEIAIDCCKSDLCVLAYECWLNHANNYNLLRRRQNVGMQPEFKFKPLLKLPWRIFVFLRHNNIKLSFGTNFFINITRTERVHGYCILIVTHVVIPGNVHNRFVSKIWEIKSIRKSISLLWCWF